MVNLQVNPAFPTSFNNTQTLENYGINVGVIFGGFIVAGILLSITMIVMCACFCCRKPKEYSQTYIKKVHLAISAAIIVIAVVACGVGWGYNSTCNNGVRHMSGSISVLVNGSSGLILNIDNSINKLAADLNTEVDNTTSQIQFDDLLTPINEIVEEVGYARDTTNALFVLTLDMISNTTIIKEDFEFMANSSANLTNLPAATDIPDINPSFSDSIISGNASIQNMYGIVINIRNQVNDTINKVGNNMIVNLKQQTKDYTSKVSDLTSNFKNVRSNLDDVQSRYDGTYHAQINKYSYYRTSVVSGILVLPIVISLVMGVGIFFRNTVLLKIVATLSFIFLFWYMLIAGVNYTLWTVTSGFCAVQDELITVALGNLKENTTVGNHTFRLSDKVLELLKCSGDTNIIEVFEANFLIDDLIGQVQSQATDISNQVHTLNFTNDFSNAQADLSDFNNRTTSLDYFQNKNITDVEDKLHNNVGKLNVLLDAAQASFNNSLADVNKITLNAQYPNGTHISVRYYESTIDSLNCNDTTWKDITQHNDLCGNQTVAQDKHRKLVDVNVTFTHAEDATERVEVIPDDLRFVNQSQADIRADVAAITNYIGEGSTGINKFVSKVDQAINSLVSFVSVEAHSLEGSTGCSFVGDAYFGFTNGFCKELSPSLRVIGAMMVLGAGALFGTAVHSCVAIYKIRGSEDDPDHDQYAVDEEKGKKNVSLHVRSSQD